MIFCTVLFWVTLKMSHHIRNRIGRYGIKRYTLKSFTRPIFTCSNLHSNFFLYASQHCEYSIFMGQWSQVLYNDCDVFSLSASGAYHMEQNRKKNSMIMKNDGIWEWKKLIPNSDSEGIILFDRKPTRIQSELEFICSNSIAKFDWCTMYVVAL